MKEDADLQTLIHTDDTIVGVEEENPEDILREKMLLFLEEKGVLENIQTLVENPSTDLRLLSTFLKTLYTEFEP